jgi:hypothetical protein
MSKKITRAEWSKQHTQCMFCLAQPYRASLLDCHEICGGVNRAKALKEPACWLRVCGERTYRRCHDLVSRLGKAEQLAIKQLHDPDHYDLDAFLAIYRPKCTPAYRAEMEAQIEAIIEKEA